MPTDSGYPDSAPAIDQLLETLCHPVRREIIDYFENVSESKTGSVPELTAHLTSRLPSATDESIRVELSHVHLPKLGKRGWLDYGSESGHIEYHGHPEARALLDDVRAIF